MADKVEKIHEEREDFFSLGASSRVYVDE